MLCTSVTEGNGLLFYVELLPEFINGTKLRYREDLIKLAVLCGNDFASIPGIGIRKAQKIIETYPNKSTLEVWQ